MPEESGEGTEVAGLTPCPPGALELYAGPRVVVREDVLDLQTEQSFLVRRAICLVPWRGMWSAFRIDWRTIWPNLLAQ